MLPTWTILFAAVLVFAVALWWLARFLVGRIAARRQGALMSRMDWTRQPAPTRRATPKKGVIAQILR